MASPGLLEPVASQGQLDDGARARLGPLDEARPRPARARRDQQPERPVLEPGDGVVAPGVVAHVKAGELAGRPRADRPLQLQRHLPDAGRQAPLGDDGGAVLALGQHAGPGGGPGGGPGAHGGGDHGQAPGAERLAGGSHPAHHGAGNAQAPGVLTGQEQAGHRRARAQRPGFVALRRGGHPVECSGRVRRVVLEGQGRGDLRVLHQLAQAGHGGLRERQHAGGDALLERGVLGAAAPLRAVRPRAEGPGAAEGDDLGRVRPPPGLDGGEGDEDAVRPSGQQGGRARIRIGLAVAAGLVVEVPADPDVAAVHADTARVLAQAQEHGHGRHPGAQARNGSPRRGRGASDGAVDGQQAGQRGGRARGGDDDGGAVGPLARIRAPAVQHPHSGGGAVLDEDLRDLLGDADGPSRLLDPLLEGARDAGAAALGEPAAAEVVGDDHRVRGEGRARGRQAVIAPLAGQDGPEGGGANTGVQVGLRRAGGGAPGQALKKSEERGRGPGHHLLGEAERRPGRGAADVLEVAPDRPRLGGGRPR